MGGRAAEVYFFKCRCWYSKKLLKSDVVAYVWILIVVLKWVKAVVQRTPVFDDVDGERRRLGLGMSVV